MTIYFKGLDERIRKTEEPKAFYLNPLQNGGSLKFRTLKSKIWIQPVKYLIYNILNHGECTLMLSFYRHYTIGSLNKCDNKWHVLCTI